MKKVLGAALAAMFLAAGCIETPALDPNDGLEILNLVPATEPLWFNPQTTPHPAYNFPTLTHPAVGLNGSHVPVWWQPIPAADLPKPIKGMEHVAPTKTEQGGGMSVFGSLAVVPSFSARIPSKVVDISDPTEPKVIGKFPKGVSFRNVDFIPFPDGRLFVVMATQDEGLHFFDLTNPEDPEEGPIVTSKSRSNHKVNVVPGTPIVYNAGSTGGGTGSGHVPSQASGYTEIYDFSNPEEDPEEIIFSNGYSCHHIYFWINPAQDKYRAICAGIEVTQIWDIRDPLKPEVIVTVPVHHGDPSLPSASVPITLFSHFAILNYEGNVLVVGDETGGGLIPPGCVGNVRSPAGEQSTPVGALWFYDVSDEKNPRLLGWYSPGTQVAQNPNLASCTAHHGRLVPDPDKRDLLAMAFYGAGVVLVDFSNPQAPKTVDQWIDATNTWEAQYYNGYIFTGDLNRGMDVLKFR